MSRLLQDHHSVQPRSDCGAVCRLFHGPLPAHGGESSTDRRLFIQKETALVGHHWGGEWWKLDGLQVSLPRSWCSNQGMESGDTNHFYCQKCLVLFSTPSLPQIQFLPLNKLRVRDKIILHVCHPFLFWNHLMALKLSGQHQATNLHSAQLNICVLELGTNSDTNTYIYQVIATVKWTFKRQWFYLCLLQSQWCGCRAGRPALPERGSIQRNTLPVFPAACKTVLWHYMESQWTSIMAVNFSVLASFLWKC